MKADLPHSQAESGGTASYPRGALCGYVHRPPPLVDIAAHYHIRNVMPAPVDISSAAELDRILSTAGGKLTVIDFHATCASVIPAAERANGLLTCFRVRSMPCDWPCLCASGAGAHG